MGNHGSVADEQEVILCECDEVLRGHTCAIEALCCYNHLIFSCARDRKDILIRTWNVETRDCVSSLPTNEAPIRTLRVFGESLFSGGDDGQLRGWRLLDKLAPMDPRSGHIGSIESIVAGLAPDLKDPTTPAPVVCTSSDDGSIRVWRCSSEDYASEAILPPLEVVTPDTPRCVQMTFSNGGIIAAMTDGTIQKWAVTEGRWACVCTVKNPEAALCLEAYGSLAIVGTYSGRVHVWNMEDGQHVAMLEDHDGSVDWIHCFDDAEAMVMCTIGEEKIARTYTLDLARSDGPVHFRCPLEGHTKRFRTSIKFSSLLLTSSADETVRIWEPVLGTCLFVLTGVPGVQRLAATITHSGLSVLGGSTDGSIAVWNPDLTLRGVRVEGFAAIAGASVNEPGAYAFQNEQDDVMYTL